MPLSIDRRSANFPRSNFLDPSSLSKERPRNLGRDFHILDAVTKIGSVFYKFFQVRTATRSPVYLFFNHARNMGSPFAPPKSVFLECEDTRIGMHKCI